jgi:hypothetical protein
MISTVSLSFDLTYTNPVTGALQPRGIVTDSTDYIGLGLTPLVGRLKGLGVITFNGDIIVDLNTIGTPMIDLENWDFVNDGVPTYYFNLPLDLNNNVANGVYTFTYSLRVLADPFLGISLGGVVSAPNVLTVASNEWLYQFLEPSNNIVLFDGVNLSPTLVSSTSYVDPDSVIVLATPPAVGAYAVTFSLTNVQLSGVYTYSGCTQTTADVNFVYDCEYGDSGTWGVTNTTVLASNEVVASLNCAINYPSWATLSPTFPGNIVVTSLPYPPAGVETPLATGTYSVSLTEQIQQSQTDGLILLYTTSVVKEFAVSCAGSLCGLTPCIESLRVAHANELHRNRVSKYQVFVDNVLLYYAEAQNYRACGETANYKATLELIKSNLDASGCECACCDENTYYWVSNNSAVSVIDSLIQSFQFRLFDLDPSGPGSPLPTDDVTEGVQVGALWQNVNTGVIYRCTDNTAANAIWVEYYAPGIIDAADVTAAPNAPFLTGTDVQNQLSQANTQFASQLLANAQFAADINAVEVTLAALDGINGLTKVGDDFRLGGTLDAATTIDVDGNSFTIFDETNPLILLVDGPFPSVGQNLVLQTSVNGGSGANGIGSSIEFQSETTAGAVNRTAVIRSRWTDAAAQDSDFQIAITEGGALDIGLTVNADKSVTLNGYNSTTFEDPAPAYLLGVDAAGNAVQVPSANTLVFAGRTRFSAGSITISEFGNTTGATISISNSGVGIYTITASSSIFTTANTVAFVQLQGAAGFTTALVTNTTTITINTYNASGVLNDAVIDPGSFIKIETYS